jgi:hypothetical protein
MIMSEDFTEETLLEALAAELSSDNRSKSEPGTITRPELMKRFPGLGVGRATKALDALVDGGLLIRDRVHRVNGWGSGYYTMGYRYTPPSEF